jgi:hypothetical protein
MRFEQRLKPLSDDRVSLILPHGIVVRKNDHEISSARLPG